jgi:hypothetical protein
MLKWDDDNEPVQLEYNRVQPRAPLTPREFQERARRIGGIVMCLLMFGLLALLAIAGILGVGPGR